MLADLNGFKRYNDTFGHPAGDALLRRLGRRLAAACEGRGTAARLGGDEFCVLLFGDVAADAAHALVRAALSDEGEGFLITAASGLAVVPGDARDPSAALRLADSRMYAAKISGHPSAEQRMSGALTRMLDERHPGLGEPCRGGGRPGRGLRRGARPPRRTTSGRSNAPRSCTISARSPSPPRSSPSEGPLNDDEWAFMRRHSIIGERILAGVPALERVALMVRSSHERWDGEGYPDGLAGAEIPIGARIIARRRRLLRDDRGAALRRRAHRATSARQELRACSGSQFDPAVVTALLAALDSGVPRPAPPGLTRAGADLSEPISSGDRAS